MVDEFQDTNYLQYELIKMIVKPHGNLIVVGDDDQTIYSFNGARNEFILNFQQQYPEANTVTLDINYRSVSSIVGLGNEVIRRNVERKHKTLQSTKRSSCIPLFTTPSTTDEEASIVITHIQSQIEEGNRQYKDYAILHRTASSSRAMFEQLIVHNIPFTLHTMGDQSFYEQWVVKPVIDHLRLSLDPQNMDAIEGILNTFYVNKDRGMAYIHSQEAMKRKEYPLIHLSMLPELKDYQKEKVKERMEQISHLREVKPANAIRQIRERFYDRFIEANDRQKNTLHKETIKETLDELESSAKRFETIDSFIVFIDQMIVKQIELQQRKWDHDVDAISLMTIHRSKGLEFPVVFMIGVSEGILPHVSAIEADKLEDPYTGLERKEKVSAAIEEERRLAYVAITRAQEELYISSPAYYRGKKAEVSRFILDVFPAETSPINSTGQTKSTIKVTTTLGRQPAHRSTVKESVLAWVCSSSGCIAWSRISSYEEAQLESKKCPLCSNPMEKGKKEVVSHH